MCAACNGAGILDKRQYRELTETPRQPFHISASQRPLASDKAATPSYTFTITGKNRKQERERKRRHNAEKAVKGRHKRSKKSDPVVADSEDEGVDEIDQDVAESNSGDAADTDDVSTLQKALSLSPQRQSTPLPSNSSINQPSTPTADGEIEAKTATSNETKAAAALKLGLGKDSKTSQAAFDAILRAVFAVSGPQAMEDLLGLYQKWCEGLVYETRPEVERKTAELRAEWNGRVLDSVDKAAIVDVHVSAY